MTRKFRVLAFPALALLVGLGLSAIISYAATFTSTPALAAGGTTLACYVDAVNSVTLSLGGRSLPPNSILRVPSGASCPIGETSIDLSVPGPKGDTGDKGDKGDTGDTGPKGDPTYIRTVVVSPTGTATANGTALLAALASIQAAVPAPSSTNPYLLKLEPGIYDLGSQSLTMRAFVDLEGSGEDTTTITSAITSPTTPPTGTIIGANNSEMRLFKVINTGTGSNNAAIYANGLSKAAKISHLTISDTGSGVSNYGIYNNSASPTIQTATITASGGSINVGINNDTAANPVIQNTTITVSGGTDIGINNTTNSSPTIQNTTITASAGPNSYGIFNYVSNPLIQNTIITASGSGNNFGIDNSSASPTILSTNITVSGGTTNRGIDNSNSSNPTIQNATVTVSGGTTSNFGLNDDFSNPAIQNSTITASGTASRGINNTNTSNPTI